MEVQHEISLISVVEEEMFKYWSHYLQNCVKNCTQFNVLSVALVNPRIFVTQEYN